jgi:hypothetical protein
MSDLPEPFTPADCDLRDFTFMPLDVVRLRDSEISVVSNGDEFRCAVLLWCAAWHQVPAASIPDDDVVLAQLAGFGRVIREWKKVREGALRGWIKCADGRLYHPVVAEKANEAWSGRVAYREKKEADRVRKAAARAAQKAQDEAYLSSQNPVDTRTMSGGQPDDFPRTSSGSPAEIALKETVERERDSGEGQLTPKPHAGAKAPDADASPDPKSTIWKIGVGLLIAAGAAEPQARAFLGKHARADESKLAEVIGYLSANPKIEPKAYIAAAMAPKPLQVAF